MTNANPEIHRRMLADLARDLPCSKLSIAWNSSLLEHEGRQTRLDGHAGTSVSSTFSAGDVVGRLSFMDASIQIDSRLFADQVAARVSLAVTIHDRQRSAAIAERERIMVALRAGVLQELTIAALQLEAFARSLPAPSNDTAKQLGLLISRQQRAMREIRSADNEAAVSA